MTDIETVIELKQARTRCWGVWLAHLVCAPLASIIYATKNEYWLPTICATSIAVVGLPLALIDLGLTTGIIAPVTSAGMIVAKVSESRRKRGIHFPEEADINYYDALK